MWALATPPSLWYWYHQLQAHHQRNEHKIEKTQNWPREGEGSARKKKIKGNVSKVCDGIENFLGMASEQTQILAQKLGNLIDTSSNAIKQTLDAFKDTFKQALGILGKVAEAYMKHLDSKFQGSSK